MKIRFAERLTAGLLMLLITGCIQNTAVSRQVSATGRATCTLSTSVSSAESAAPAASEGGESALSYESYFAQERQINDEVSTIYHVQTDYLPFAEHGCVELYGGEKRLSNMPFYSDCIRATTDEFLFSNGGRTIFRLDCSRDEPEPVCAAPAGERIIQIYRCDTKVIFFETDKRNVYRFYRPEPKLDQLLTLPQQDYWDWFVMNNNEIAVETFTPVYYEILKKYGEGYKGYIDWDTPIILKHTLYNFRTGSVSEIDDRVWKTTYFSTTKN